MEEHIEIKKQILTELKDWLTETGFNSNVFLKKLKQPIKDQLSNLSEDDIFFSKPFEIEGYFATYIMEIITRFTHSDGTYGDSYMEPLDEYNPNCEVFTKEFNHLCLNEQRMVTDVGDQSKFDHGIELVTDYVKKEFRRRNQRDLYNYPRVIIKTQIKKINITAQFKDEYPWRCVYAKLKNSNGEEVYLLLNYYNFETNQSFNYGQNLKSDNLQLSTNDWRRAPIKKGLFGISF